MKSDDKERLDLENVTEHHMPDGIWDLDDETYFPINHSQASDLLGKILTQLESMNLREQTELATKAIFKQMVWRWFDEVMENSVTSAKGCIAPIKLEKSFTSASQPYCITCGKYLDEEEVEKYIDRCKTHKR